MSDTCLQTSLSAAVPLWILEKQKQSWAEIQQRIPYCLQMIVEHADDALFKSKVKGQTAAAFNAIAEAIAILSFVPGGVTTFGSHWETQFKGAFTEKDRR